MTLSIIVAASNHAALLAGCLDSLQDQAHETGAELIVVSNYPLEPAKTGDKTLQERFPAVKFLALPPATTVPALRTQGINSASGDIVALLEDNLVADKNWCAQIIAAHRLARGVAGGSVENRVGGALNWAVYFYEYGKYMRPNRAGATDTLAGNNVSYQKAALASVAESIRDGFYEAFVHPQLMAMGHPLYLAPEAVVTHCKRYHLREVLSQCYHHGRAFAAMRTARTSRLKRGLYAVAALLLPVILPARIVRRTWAKGRNRRQLLMALPFLFFLLSVWAFGEWCGTTRGAGASASRWR